MKIIHTSHWHLGCNQYGYDFLPEQKQFLNWLLETILESETNTIVISGHIFSPNRCKPDVQILFYNFLSQLKKNRPVIQVILLPSLCHNTALITPPKIVVKDLNLTIIKPKFLSQLDDVAVDDHIIPIVDSVNKTIACCGVLPYIHTKNSHNSLSTTNKLINQLKVHPFYPKILTQLKKQLYPKQTSFIVACDQFQLMHKNSSDIQHFYLLPIDQFEIYFNSNKTDENTKQNKTTLSTRLPTQPMSFSSETAPDIACTQLIEFTQYEITDNKTIIKPVLIPSQQLPTEHYGSIAEIISLLNQLPEKIIDSTNVDPSIIINLLSNKYSFEYHKKIILQNIKNKAVRLAHINIKYTHQQKEYISDSINDALKLEPSITKMDPKTLFIDAWQQKYNTPPSQEELEAFNELLDSAQSHLSNEEEYLP